MKTRIIILSFVISLLTITLAITRPVGHVKFPSAKSVSTEARVIKGLAMEDRNQVD